MAAKEKLVAAVTDIISRYGNKVVNVTEGKPGTMLDTNVYALLGSQVEEICQACREQNTPLPVISITSVELPHIQIILP